MPTYEYRCGSCGNHFEKFSAKISDQSSVACPDCGADAERLISGGAGLLFKGSGFYATDYRSPSYKEAEKKETKEPKDQASGAEPGSKKPPSAEPPKKGSKKDSD